MTERYSIAEASRNLSRLVHEAERGKTVELTRSGASSVDLAELNLDPDELFSEVRADTQGRR